MSFSDPIPQTLFDNNADHNALVTALLFPSKYYAIHRRHLFFDNDDQIEPAFYWAYKIYNAGNHKQLSDLLWRIYFDFYAVRYEYLEKYFIKYLTPHSIAKNPKVIGIIVRNLLYNRPTLDVFLLLRGYYPISHPPDRQFEKSTAALTEFQDIIYQIHHLQLPLQPPTLKKMLQDIAVFCNVAPQHHADFINAIMNFPQLPQLGMKRLLVYTCTAYQYTHVYEYSQDTAPLILRKYNNTTDESHIDDPSSDEDEDTNAPPTTPNMDADADADADADVPVTVTLDETSKLKKMAYQYYYLVANANIAHIITTTNIAPIPEFVMERPLLPYSPIAPRLSHPITSVITRIVGDKKTLPWYIQLAARCELTPESLENSNFKGLKKYIVSVSDVLTSARITKNPQVATLT